MTNMNRTLKTMMMSFLLLCLAAGGFQIVFAQGPPSDRERDPLARLTRALSAAGAPALTEQQETQLRAAIAEFQQSRRAQEPNETIEAARRAFDEAIVVGDTAAIQAQAAIIVEQLALLTRSHLQAEATFKLQVLDILTDEQVNQLLQRIGTAGLSRVLDSLAFRGGLAPGSGPDGPGRDRR
jgi:Spy/CpxP family protein refolding chaperone